jgi:alpha-glucoside transport system ATP-binding protein
VENLGELVMAYVDLGGGEPLIVKLPGTSAAKAGDEIALSADPKTLHLFDEAGRALRA